MVVEVRKRHMKTFYIDDLVSFIIKDSVMLGYVVKSTNANNYLIKLTPLTEVWIAGDMLTLESRLPTL